MSRVVEHLAELTGYRDRDVLDVSLVGALKDLLRPQAVAIYRRVGETDSEHWLTRARLGAGDTTATADPLWVDIDTLPRLDAHPERHACLLRQEAFVAAASPAAPAMAWFPLATEVQAVGVLEISTAAPLSPEQVRLVGSILRVYRNVQGLLDYSERDTLTGLLNRKTYDENFMRLSSQELPVSPSRSVGEARRPGAGGGLLGSWLAVIDIDHFKRVNDNHGHLIGDEVLLLLSRLMRTSFRFHDHLYRFGGEEFVVLMRCNGAADAVAALQRLRTRVENYAFPQVGRITVSIGYTALRLSDTPSSAFERADKSVYHVKQNGRNQVAGHADLVDAGQLTEALRDSDVELF
jgi:diguanylate cyclase (GGDEF)-like protein